MPACATCQRDLTSGDVFCPTCGTPNPDGRTMTPPDAGVATTMLPADSLKPRLQEAIGADYVVESEIGEGGFAHVFAVTDRKLQRRIAVKVLRPEFTANAASVRRFIREAESAARINHPHILPIYFVGEKAGLVYFAMPLVDGETLDARLRREGQLPEVEVIRLGSEIADALAEAHTHGLVHRDIKPQNVMLQGPKKRAMVMDFGIAKAAAGSGEKLTGTGVIIGSPHYMSPEQAGGDPEIDMRSDLYSLGIVLWEMLAGEVPFDGPSTQGILIQHLTQSVPAIRTRRPNVTAALTKVVARAVERKKDDRFPDATALADALRASGSIVAPPSSSLGARLSRGVIGTIAAAALVLMAVIWFVIKPTSGPGTPAGDDAHGSPHSAAAKVAVLPLEALVTRDQAQFARSTAQLLTDALSSRFQVPTTDGHELLGHWTADGLKTDAPLDRKAAFAYEHGANQMVLGTAVESGRQLRLSIDVYDTHDLTRLTHADVTGLSDSLFALVEQVGEIVAASLCSQPDFNPGNRCFDGAAHPVDAPSVSDAGKRGEAAPTAPVFLVHVDSAGKADNVRLKTGSSHDDVNGAALSVVQAARYVPARLRNRPVPAWTTVTVTVHTGDTAPSATAEPAACAQPGRNEGSVCFDKRPAPLADPVAPWSGAGSPAPAVFWVRVSAAGAADSVRRLTASDQPAFTTAAERVARGLTFTPALKAGRPVAAWTQVAILPQ